MSPQLQQELSEVIQSSNINFLIGAGVSTPFLPLLGNIEKDLNNANNENEREKLYKQYFTDVMLPNRKMLNIAYKEKKCEETRQSYDAFFLSLSKLLLQRKSTILSKQINIFSTNIDICVETSLERLKIDYNDGFSGKFRPVFSSANFKKSIHQRSLHFDHISEIPVFNLVKIHGSLTWQLENDSIRFSHSLAHFDEKLVKKKGKDFLEGYRKILVVNPEEAKHLQTVLNLYYYELLRMYSSEIERENSLLFVLGFSMEDSHIREITLRAAKANPTLRILVCCSQSSQQKMETKMEIRQHQNISILTPPTDEKFTLKYFTENYLNPLLNKTVSDAATAS